MRAGLGATLAETWRRDDAITGQAARSRIAVAERAVCVFGRCSRLANRTVEADAVETSRDAFEFLSAGTHVKATFLKLEETELLFSLAFLSLDLFHLLVLDLLGEKGMISLHVVQR